jgi:hypothetical protein
VARDCYLVRQENFACKKKKKKEKENERARSEKHYCETPLALSTPFYNPVVFCPEKTISSI